jgi:UDP-N-acetylmuramoylalanine--D-glutamate ligase
MHPIHLILGGEDKGVDLNPLFQEMQNLNIKIYAIGKNTHTLLALAKTYTIKCHISHTIEMAIKEISQVLDLNEVALLSPASASFDQFNSYKHRGETFIECVKSLKK